MPGSQLPNCRLLLCHICSLLPAPCSLLPAPCSLLLAQVRSLELYSLLESATLGLKARFFRAPVLRAFSCRRAYLARLDEIIS